MLGFFKVQAYLLSSPSRNLTAARVKEKQLPQRARGTYLKQGGKRVCAAHWGEDGDGASDPSEGGQMEFVPLHGSGQSELRACERYRLDGPRCKGKAALPARHSPTRVHHGNVIAFLIRNMINQGPLREFALRRGTTLFNPGDFLFPFPSCQSAACGNHHPHLNAPPRRLGCKG